MGLAGITDTDIARSRADPRFKQVLLARSLEQLLAALYRLQHGEVGEEPVNIGHLREGAVMAIQVADLIRTLDERLGPAQPR